MKKDTRVTIQCPLFRRGKKFEGIITGEKTLAALHIAKHGRTYFVKLDGNNKSTQFHESWLAELPAPSTPVKETEPAPTPTSKEGLEDGFTFSLFNSDEEYNYYDIDLKGVAIGQLKVLKGESQAILTRINKD